VPIFTDAEAAITFAMASTGTISQKYKSIMSNFRTSYNKYLYRAGVCEISPNFLHQRPMKLTFGTFHNNVFDVIYVFFIK